MDEKIADWHDKCRPVPRQKLRLSNRFRHFHWKPKKKWKNKVECAHSSCTHFATNSINESNRIEPKKKSITECNELDRKLVVNGVRAPRWQLEERDRGWMTCCDLGWHMHMTPVKHIPFLFLSLSLVRCGPPPYLRSTNLQTKHKVITRELWRICKRLKYNICAHDNMEERWKTWR